MLNKMLNLQLSQSMQLLLFNEVLTSPITRNIKSIYPSHYILKKPHEVQKLKHSVDMY